MNNHNHGLGWNIITDLYPSANDGLGKIGAGLVNLC